MNGKVKETGDKILLSKLPVKKWSFVLRRTAKLIIFALAAQEDYYGPLERRVFDLQFSG